MKYNPKRQRKGQMVEGWYMGKTLVQGLVIRSELIVNGVRQHSVQLTKPARTPYGHVKQVGDVVVLEELELVGFMQG